jgi:hypothetical protein
MASRRRSGLSTDRRAYGCSRDCPKQYTVTYNGNENTSGNVPIDVSSPYKSRLIVTILGNSGSLVKSGYLFAEWNTIEDGSGTSYVQGDTFKITANTTLYAQWTPTYTVIYNGNTNTSGNVPTDGSSPYITGSTVTVLGNSGSLAKSGYLFSGWDTFADGSGTSYVQGNTFTITANTILYAQWIWIPATPPSAPIITSATPFETSIQITFTPPSDGGSPITNYEYSLNGGSSWTPFSPVDTTSPVTVSGLTSGQAYTVYLRAVNSVGPGPASNAVTRTTLAVPGAPSSLSAIPGSTTIQITFTEPSDGGSPITNYQYSLNGGTSWTSFSSSPVNITGLTNGTVYNIKLRAVNAIGSGTASDQIDIAPFPGNNFNPKTLTEYQPNLWLDGQSPLNVGISGTNVSYWEDKSIEGNEFASSSTGTIKYSQPSGINNRPAIYFETSFPPSSSTTYLSRSFNIAPTNQLSLFMVVNHVSTGTSGNSELFYSRAGPTTPGYAYFDLFSNMQSTNPIINGRLSINIGNDAQVSTGVDIRGTIALIDVIAAGTTDIYVNGTQTNNDIPRGPLSLDNQITWAISGGAFQGYVGEVIAYPSGLSDNDRQKVEGYLAWKWGLQANLPNTQPYKNAPPINLAAPVITGITASYRSLSVDFTQVNNDPNITITNYQYSTDNGDTFIELRNPNATSPITIDRLSMDGTRPLNNGTRYEVIIQAKTANGLGLVSNVVEATTPSPPAPDTPTLSSIVPGNQAAYILFTQGGSVPVDNYVYSTDDGNTFFLLNPSQIYSPIVITKLSSDGVTPLTNGTTYTVKLRAMNDGARSGISNSIDVTPATTSLVSSNRIIHLDANNASSYSGSGTAWTNLDSGGAYSATLNGTPTFNDTDTSNNYFGFNPGTVTGQFALINQAAAINPVPNQPFTIQMWVRINTVGSQGTLVNKVFFDNERDANNLSGLNDGYALTYMENTKLELHENGGLVYYFRSGTGVLSSGWALYTANVQFGNGGGRQNKIFVNGRQVVAETSNDGISNSTKNLSFPGGGPYGQSNGGGFRGEGRCDIGEFYYYNTELTQTQIIQNYDATKSRYI